MTFLQAAEPSRTRALWLVCAITLGAVSWASPSGSAPPPRACVQDSLENWYCPTDPKGSAVIESLGTPACAAGACVRVDDEWQCSSVSGGTAVLTPEGAECEGGCRAPRASECERR